MRDVHASMRIHQLSNQSLAYQHVSKLRVSKGIIRGSMACTSVLLMMRSSNLTVMGQHRPHGAPQNGATSAPQTATRPSRPRCISAPRSLHSPMLPAAVCQMTCPSTAPARKPGAEIFLFRLSEERFPYLYFKVFRRERGQGGVFTRIPTFGCHRSTILLLAHHAAASPLEPRDTTDHVCTSHARCLSIGLSDHAQPAFPQTTRAQDDDQA